MFYDKFKVDNSRFGAVLSEEMTNHHITAISFSGLCRHAQGKCLCNLKG